MTDDIMMFGKNPKAFFNDITLGVGPSVYHRGGDFFRDKNHTSAWGTTSYVKKMIQNFEIMFKEKPKEFSSPMAEKNHPELDLSDELGPEDIKRYQSLIGALQWLIKLGRF